MSKYNIYDKIVSELILRISALTSTSTAQLKITNSLNSEVVPVGYGGNVVFTSEVQNMPTNYTVKTNTHVITYPATSAETFSVSPASGTATAVALGALGNTFTVTSTVILEDLITLSADITLTATHTITAISPAYFGVQAYSSSPTTGALTSMASTDTSFQMTTSTYGRLVLALPTGSSIPVTITGPNGLIYVIADDFNSVTNGGYDFYQLNYDTQLTGANIKTFSISYN